VPNPAPLPELLAPAGDWDALRAAVSNGANAVYFGLPNFNARHRATNFTREELGKVLEYLHAHNVRGYIALNTLIFSDELPEIAKVAAELAEAGADAVIVQDLGLVKLLKRLVPDLPVHGSTQMTLTEPVGIEFVRRLGVERVILARELSLSDIGQITAATDMPVEVFVHGALCVAYSGQCLTSEALGGRSANRGQCAQACRLPYEMLVDGQHRELGDRAYLLSPQDLAAPELIEPLVKLGVSCFKIEGRLKSAQYVSATTDTYRKALTAALAGTPFSMTRQEELDLAQSFSRGLTHGFLDGVNHQELVQGRFPKSRGVRVGTVNGRTPRGVLVQLAEGEDVRLLVPGDGIVFDEGHPDQDEAGGRVWEIFPGTLPGEVEVLFQFGAVNLAAIAPGALVWKTDDPVLRKRLEHSYSRDVVVVRSPVSFAVSGKVGGALSIRVCEGAKSPSDSNLQGTIEVTWPGPIQRAIKHPASAESLREQLGRLGETPYELAEVTLDADEPIMIPKSALNELRRTAMEQLLAARGTRSKRLVVSPNALAELRGEVRQRPASSVEAPSKMYVMARTIAQLEAVLAWQPSAELPRPAMVYCDFEDPRRYKEAAQLAQAAGMPMGAATMRVAKPGEEAFFARMTESGADAVLIRNLSGLVYFREQAPHLARIGDFSLNVANELTAELLLAEGCERLVPSYDLNWDQLGAMLRVVDPTPFELVIHQHMPMFHMEHCVFAAFLSTGKDFRDCGRPCDTHRVELRDRVGAEFPVVVDAGCRNTVFNHVPQSAAEYVPRMKALGVRHFRVELLRETASEVAPLLERYARVLAGLEQGRVAWRGLQVLNQLGVTRGTLEG